MRTTSQSQFTIFHPMYFLQFDWLFFIQSMYETINPAAISEDSQIVVHALDYLINMTALVKTTPKR